MRIFRLKDGRETRRGQLERNSCLVLLAVGGGSFDSPLGPLPSPRAACNQGLTRTGRATACVKPCQHNTEAFLALFCFFFCPCQLCSAVVKSINSLQTHMLRPPPIMYLRPTTQLSLISLLSMRSRPPISIRNQHAFSMPLGTIHRHSAGELS